MAIDYVALAAELTAGHPVTGAYNVDDALAAAELNAVNRPNDSAAGDVLDYMLTKTHRTNTGTDTAYSNILGRLYHAAESDVGASPFGQTDTMLQTQKHACMCLVAWLESPHSGDTDTGDTALPLGLVNAADVFSTTHKTAIEDLSKDQVSRAQEVGLGHIDQQDVQIARAL